jgi:hypothetical protein
MSRAVVLSPGEEALGEDGDQHNFDERAPLLVSSRGWEGLSLAEAGNIGVE